MDRNPAYPAAVEALKEPILARSPYTGAGISITETGLTKSLALATYENAYGGTRQ